MTILQAALPAAAVGTSRTAARATDAWHECLLELRRIRRLLQDFALWPSNQFDWGRVVLDKAQSLMREADALSRRTGQTSSASATMDDWDNFRTQPSAWAQSVGFGVEADMVYTPHSTLPSQATMPHLLRSSPPGLRRRCRGSFRSASSIPGAAARQWPASSTVRC